MKDNELIYSIVIPEDELPEQFLKLTVISSRALVAGEELVYWPNLVVPQSTALMSGITDSSGCSVFQPHLDGDSVCDKKITGSAQVQRRHYPPTWLDSL